MRRELHLKKTSQAMTTTSSCSLVQGSTEAEGLHVGSANVRAYSNKTNDNVLYEKSISRRKTGNGKWEKSGGN